MSSQAQFTLDQARAAGERIGVDWGYSAFGLEPLPAWGWTSSLSTARAIRRRMSPTMTLSPLSKMEAEAKANRVDEHLRLNPQGGRRDNYSDVPWWP